MNHVAFPVYEKSLTVAQRFHKRHSAVLRDLDRWQRLLPDLSDNMRMSTYESRGRDYRCYELTRKGFHTVSACYKYPTRLNFLYKEGLVFTTIEQLLNVKILRQFKVGDYRVDGYCRETNTVYEVDEGHHYQNRTDCLVKPCEERQKAIESLLGCSFVRIRVD